MLGEGFFRPPSKPAQILLSHSVSNFLQAKSTQFDVDVNICELEGDPKKPGTPYASVRKMLRRVAYKISLQLSRLGEITADAAILCFLKLPFK